MSSLRKGDTRFSKVSPHVYVKSTRNRLSREFTGAAEACAKNLKKNIVVR